VAEHRHKRDTNARRMPRATVVAGPLAVLATASAVGLGVLASDPAARDLLTAADASSSVSAAAPRQQVISRGGGRDEIEPLSKEERVTSAAATRQAVRSADTKRWTAEALNLWTEPGADADQVGEVDAGEKVLVTGRTLDGRVEIVVDGTARWVSEGYLTDEKPFAIGADCTNGTSVPSGVSPNIVKVHQAVCAAFPEISTYGTFRGDGEHSQGLAVDIMVSGSRGWEVAEFVREHYADLGVSYVIYSQKIWSVERSGEGWRGMSDRGSVTANHYDHVHVTTY
jgi:hypothetical protein